MQRTFIVAVLILLVATTGHAFIDNTKLYVDLHRYFDDLLVIGIEFETAEWQGFSARFGYEHPSVLTTATGRGDPPGAIPVKSIYHIALEKRIAAGWHVSYNHFSAHWHKLAADWYGYDVGSGGWYGDTYWRLEYRW